MERSLQDLFCQAVTIDGPSLREQPVANFVRRQLEGLPVHIHEDSAGEKIGGNSGNLICVPAWFDPARPAVALLAHLDTPRPTVDVRPVITDSRICSDGTTALGVDNRAGLSILLQTLREQLASPGEGNFIVVFTVAEEIGLFGSKHVDLSTYNIQACFVFDCSKRPGTFIQSAVGCTLYTATFLGKASHAAVSPEQGISAIQIAARALQVIPHGRITSTMTSNVGTISGGTETNVVPDRCTIRGEVREFHQDRIDRHLAFLEETFQNAAITLGGGLEFNRIEDFAPFRLQPEHEVFKLTMNVLKKLGLAPHPIEYLGGSDANMLNAKGIPAVNLGIGAQNPHGNDEFILIEDLYTSAAIAREIIRTSNGIHA
jgi:tripeptide aminopeptidase